MEGGCHVRGARAPPLYGNCPYMATTLDSSAPRVGHDGERVRKVFVRHVGGVEGAIVVDHVDEGADDVALALPF